MTDLNRAASAAYEIAKIRESNTDKCSTDTLAMLKHLAGEVVEATEAYFTSFETIGDFESELADIIVCTLIIAGKEDIDIEKAVLECMQKNRKRALGRGDKL